MRRPGGAVYTKRLLRQIVTPSALTYALLGFFGGLLWLSLSTRVPALVTPSGTDAPRPLTASSTGRVSLQESIDAVRRFAGEPSLVLEGGLQADSDQSGGAICTTWRRSRPLVARTSSKLMPGPLK